MFFHYIGAIIQPNLIDTGLLRLTLVGTMYFSTLNLIYRQSCVCEVFNVNCQLSYWHDPFPLKRSNG